MRPGLFAHALSNVRPHPVKPARILATRPTEAAKSKRELHTASPTAKLLKVEIEDIPHH